MMCSGAVTQQNDGDYKFACSGRKDMPINRNQLFGKKMLCPK